MNPQSSHWVPILSLDLVNLKGGSYLLICLTQYWGGVWVWKFDPFPYLIYTVQDLSIAVNLPQK